jgi:hypothetical protein
LSLFHGENTGSIPVGRAKEIKDLSTEHKLRWPELCLSAFSLQANERDWRRHRTYLLETRSIATFSFSAIARIDQSSAANAGSSDDDMSPRRRFQRRIITLSMSSPRSAW